MDDFVFPFGSLANMTCQLIELGSFNPIFTYQLERQICKIEAGKSRAEEVSGIFSLANLTPAQRFDYFFSIVPSYVSIRLVYA